MTTIRRFPDYRSEPLEQQLENGLPPIIGLASGGGPATSHPFAVKFSL